jgi:hypothetical protein
MTLMHLRYLNKKLVGGRINLLQLRPYITPGSAIRGGVGRYGLRIAIYNIIEYN